LATVEDYIEELKTKYTQLTERVEKAELWFYAPGRTQEERERLMPEFNKVLDQLVVTYDELSKYQEITDQETLKGWRK
jgi:hypothetical protein